MTVSVPQWLKIERNHSIYRVILSLYTPCFFLQIINDAIGTGSIIDCLNKETSFLEFTFKQPVGWRFSFNPTQRNSACWNTKIFCKGLFCNPCSYHDMDWLPYRWVEPFCIFNKNRVSLYARACSLFSIIFFSITLFVFFRETQNTHYNFFFTFSRVFRRFSRVGWFGGNECSPFSTARS